MLDLRFHESNYQKYSLVRNPFPYVGVPDAGKIVFTDREEVLRNVGESIRGATKGTSSHIVLVGSYGNGKTTTLRFIQDQVKQQLENSFPIYVPNSGESFVELCRNFMYEIGYERLEQIVWSYLEQVCGKRGIKEKVIRGETLFSDIMERVKPAIFNEIKYTDFATALLKLVLDQTSFLAWRYLCGEPINSDQRRELDVVSLIDTDDKALRAFLSMKKFLKAVGYPLLCILVDELEGIEVLHPWKKQRILNGIRRLIDMCPEGLCLVLACAPEAWSDIMREYHAFSERIFREVVLKPLDKKSIKKLVATYLEYARISRERVRSEIYPFTEEALDEILLAAQGNVRRVLMVCNRAIDKGVEAGCPTIMPSHLTTFLPDIFQGEEK